MLLYINGLCILSPCKVQVPELKLNPGHESTTEQITCCMSNNICAIWKYSLKKCYS